MRTATATTVNSSQTFLESIGVPTSFSTARSNKQQETSKPVTRRVASPSDEKLSREAYNALFDPHGYEL